MARKSKVKIMSEENKSEQASTPIPITEHMAPERREDYERGVALLVNAKHDRDRAFEERDIALAQIAGLKQEVAVLVEQIEALKKLLVFAEDRAKIREAEQATTILSYRMERDEAVRQLASANAVLDLLENTVMSSIARRQATIEMTGGALPHVPQLGE